MNAAGVYQGREFVTCRRCQQLGIYNAIQVKQGETLSGMEILACGHQQDNGRVKVKAVAPPQPSSWGWGYFGS
jgi:hypothetical protein